MTTDKKDLAKDPQKDPQQEEQRKQQEEQRKHVEAKLKELRYEPIDDLNYSFVINKNRFVFKEANFYERTKIKAILADITSSTGSKMSSADEILATGDVDFICSTILATHTSILMVKSPDNFDLEKMTEAERFNLGYAIFICENNFLEEKKKESSTEQ